VEAAVVDPIATDPAAAEYHAIDRQLFRRLHEGPLLPLVFRLKNGSALIGEPRTLSRGNTFLEGGPLRYHGSVVLQTQEGDVTVDYGDVAEIA
jgi:hypothetical protein